MMAESGKSVSTGFLGELLDSERRLMARLGGVVRFEPGVYEEIEADPQAIPQAFAVVIMTSLVGALGQGFAGGLPWVFLQIAELIVFWLLMTALTWGLGALITGGTCPFPRLLRSMGFAFVWLVLRIGVGLPLVGSLFAWAAIGLFLASAVLLVRRLFETSVERALSICLVSLALPVLALLIASC